MLSHGHVEIIFLYSSKSFFVQEVEPVKGLQSWAAPSSCLVDQSPSLPQLFVQAPSASERERGNVGHRVQEKTGKSTLAKCLCKTKPSQAPQNPIQPQLSETCICSDNPPSDSAMLEAEEQ